VRSIVADWERGDYRSAEWAHSDIEFIRPDGPEPGIWTGLAGLAAGTRYRLDAWEGFRVEADEYRELDGERVLVLIRSHGRGKSSGLEIVQVQTGGAALFHVREGEVSRLVTYLNRERAFADLGLDSEAS
jgi:hypothetical protein